MEIMESSAVGHSDIVDSLARTGWSVAAGWLPSSVVMSLAAEARRERAAGAFRSAGVGRDGRVEARVRGDEILWLEASGSAALRSVLGRLDRLRETLNRELQLGAIELELHYAVYSVGAAYAVHLDRFRDEDTRVLSLVLYLNESWGEAVRGELRLYRRTGPRAPFVDVLPAGSHPETRTVKGANHCRIAVHRAPDGDTVIVLSVIDNLVKGAAGQAVQNMNIMFGFDETAGLRSIGLIP